MTTTYKASIQPPPACDVLIDYEPGYGEHRDVTSINNLLKVSGGGWTGATMAGYADSFDRAGNRMGQTASGRYKSPANGISPLAHDMVYANDGLHRLTTATYTNLDGGYEQFNYDLLGNRGGNSPAGEIGYVDTRGETLDEIGYNGNNKANEYVTIFEDPPAGGVPVSYDAAGNLVKDENGFLMEYDADNQLTRIVADKNGNGVADPPLDAVAAEYKYDALGRRIEFKNHFDGSGIYALPVVPPNEPLPVPVTTRFVHDGQNVIAEYSDLPTRQRYYVHGTSYIDERAVMHDEAVGANTDYYYLLKDHYTVVGLVNKQGHEVERYTYDAYGGTTVTSVLTADVNFDGAVNGTDWSLITSAWTGGGNPCQHGPFKDISGDGAINATDRAFVVSQWTLGEIIPGANLNQVIPASAVGNPYGFTGRARDVFLDAHGGDTGLNEVYHYRARYYDSGHGRFLQRDPVTTTTRVEWSESTNEPIVVVPNPVFSIDVEEASLYHYVSSRPLTRTDPSGLAEDHHLAVKQIWKHLADQLSPEVRKILDTTVNLEHHRGFPREHRLFNTAAREISAKFVSKLGKQSVVDLTPGEARKLVDAIQNSSRRDIRHFLDSGGARYLQKDAPKPRGRKGGGGRGIAGAVGGAALLLLTSPSVAYAPEIPFWDQFDQHQCVRCICKESTMVMTVPPWYDVFSTVEYDFSPAIEEDLGIVTIEECRAAEWVEPSHDNPWYPEGSSLGYKVFSKTTNVCQPVWSHSQWSSRR